LSSLTVVEILRDTPVVRKAIVQHCVSALSLPIANRDGGMRARDSEDDFQH
jgi:hypothetical protein